MKTCTKCGEQKSFDKYNKNYRTRDGLQYRCKSCMNQVAKEWQANNKERFKRKQAEYWRRPEIKSKYRQLKYGVTHDEYVKMLTRQNSKCLLCKEPFGETRTLLPAVDHDHITGRVRGLLHVRCNVGIGIFEDKLELLKLAWEYLNKVKV